MPFTLESQRRGESGGGVRFRRVTCHLSLVTSHRSSDIFCNAFAPSFVSATRKVGFSPPLDQAMPLNDRNGNSTSCRILVVEDSDDFRAGLARELQDIGHLITVAGERTDALA